MKLILLVTSAILATVLPSCTDSEAEGVEATQTVPENGAQFEKDKGLALTDEMARAIGLQTVDVEERTIAARVPLTLRSLPGGIKAVGWLPVAQAEKVAPGCKVEFPGLSELSGSITTIEKAVTAGPGEYEITGVHRRHRF